jgi:hypothetical protein
MLAKLPGIRLISHQEIREKLLMQIRTSLLALGAAVAIPSAVGAQVVNFHDANNGVDWSGNDPDNGTWNNRVYIGQGAYPDPGNNVWNGFGGAGPGDPLTASTGPNKTSSGAATPITLDTSYGFDNGALFYNYPTQGTPGNTAQGQPSFVLGQAAVVNGANPLGTFALHHVPTGTYNLYLFGANFDNDRGASFTVGSGTPLGGFSSTMNLKNGSPSNAFVLGANYVEFVGVAPNGNGDIIGTWGAVTNTVTGQSGEGDFNGLQLVRVPEPASLALLALGSAGVLALRRRRGRD